MTNLKSLFLTVFLLFGSMAIGCGSFYKETPNAKFMGKSYDWDNSHGLIFINKRNVSKKAINIFPGETPAKWQSRFGSLTFNQHGREFPLSGINEKGLAVEILWLNQSAYEKKDKRASINELQWIQFQLDRFASVPEALYHLNEIRIRKVSADVHYLMCDKMGECATVEFIAEKPVVHAGEFIPFKAITNSSYADSLAYLKTHKGFGGDKTVDPTDMKSLNRFARVLSKADSITSLGGMFDSLESIHQPNYTVWNLVYALDKNKVHFRTTEFKEIRTIDSTQFDYSCKTEVKMLDMDEKLSGDVTQRFVNFNEEANRTSIEKSLKGFLSLLVGPLSDYPASTKCME